MRLHLRPLAAGLFAASLLAAGCASTAAYRPIDASSRTITGQSAAYYRVVLDDDYQGNVKLWSGGGYPEKLDGEQPVIDIRLRIRNDSAEPMQLLVERMDVEIATGAGRITVLEQPLAVDGNMEIAPEGASRIRLQYALPDEIEPGDLTGFELNWSLRTGKGIYSESTGFLRVDRGGGYYFWPRYQFYWGPPYTWPYWYDPFWYGPLYP